MNIMTFFRDLIHLKQLALNNTPLHGSNCIMMNGISVRITGINEINGITGIRARIVALSLSVLPKAAL